MPDDDFKRLLDEYLDPPADQNLAMADVEIVWIEGNPSVGALHMLQKHGVSRTEVEQVLLQVPPIVEARRSPEDPGRTLFWGATRYDRWLFVVCEDIVQGGVRKLTPITAFEPEEGELYWRKYGKG